MASIRSTKVFDMTKPKMKPMQITMALAVARTLAKRNERDNDTNLGGRSSAMTTQMRVP